MAGIPERPAPPAALVDALRTAGVPLESLADACKACEGCDDEADLEDLAYPKGCVRRFKSCARSWTDRMETQFRRRPRLADVGRVEAPREVRRIPSPHAALSQTHLLSHSSNRQILVSSGKSDWIREVTDDTDSIPGLVKLAYDEVTAKPSAGLLGKIGGKLFKGKEEEEKGGLPGVHPSKAVAGADVAVSSRLCVPSFSLTPSY